MLELRPWAGLNRLGFYRNMPGSFANRIDLLRAMILAWCVLALIAVVLLWAGAGLAGEKIDALFYSRLHVGVGYREDIGDRVVALRRYDQVHVGERLERTVLDVEQERFRPSESVRVVPHLEASAGVFVPNDLVGDDPKRHRAPVLELRRADRRLQFLKSGHFASGVFVIIEYYRTLILGFPQVVHTALTGFPQLFHIASADTISAVRLAQRRFGAQR